MEENTPCLLGCCPSPTPGGGVVGGPRPSKRSGSLPKKERPADWRTPFVPGILLRGVRGVVGRLRGNSMKNVLKCTDWKLIPSAEIALCSKRRKEVDPLSPYSKLISPLWREEKRVASDRKSARERGEQHMQLGLCNAYLREKY